MLGPYWVPKEKIYWIIRENPWGGFYAIPFWATIICTNGCTNIIDTAGCWHPGCFGHPTASPAMELAPVTHLERKLWMQYGTIPALVDAFLKSDAQRQRNAEAKDGKEKGRQIKRGQNKKKKPLQSEK